MLANSLRNLSGAVVPAAINLVTIPFIVRTLGNESYGAFTLIAAIIGYFALLDINVTSGSVKYVAEHNARGERRELLEVISFGGLIYVLIGFVGAVSIYFSAELLTGHVFAISPQHMALVTSTLRVAALGFFVTQLQVYLNSIPQSLQRYDVTAFLEMAFGAGVPLGTVALLWLGHGLWEVVVFRVAASAVNVLLLLLLIGRLIPDFRWVAPSKLVARKVGAFSGYAYLARIAAVAYNHSDKLVIGALVSMTQLAFYTVPSTLVNRLLGLTFRMGSVFYPLASELNALGEHEKLERVYLSATRYLAYVNTFFVMIVSLFAYPILYWWIGDEFASQGQLVMTIMALALLIDSFTNLPSFFNDGLGHPKRTGTFAVLRAVIGLALTFVLTKMMGIFGAALAQLIASVLLSAAFLVFVHGRTIPVSLGRVLTHGYLPSVLTAALCWGVVYGFVTPQTRDWFQSLQSAAWVTSLYLALGAILVVEPGHRRHLTWRVKRLLGHAA